VSGQLHASAVLPQGRSARYLLDRRLNGPQIRPGPRRVENNLAPAGERTSAVLPLVRRHTNRTLLALIVVSVCNLQSSHASPCFFEMAGCRRELVKIKKSSLALGEILILLICSWVRVQASLFPFYFLRKKDSWIVTTTVSWLK
jgi:hypothetical protein